MILWSNCSIDVSEKERISLGAEMSHENRLNMAGLTADEILAINSVLARDEVLRKREDKRVKWLKFKTIGRNIHFAFRLFF